MPSFSRRSVSVTATSSATPRTAEATRQAHSSNIHQLDPTEPHPDESIAADELRDSIYERFGHARETLHARSYRGPVKLVVCDLSGVIADHGNHAEICSVEEVFRKKGIELESSDAPQLRNLVRAFSGHDKYTQIDELFSSYNVRLYFMWTHRTVAVHGRRIHARERRALREFDRISTRVLIIGYRMTRFAS